MKGFGNALAIVLLLASGGILLSRCGSGGYSNTGTAPTITMQPASTSVAVGAMATFNVSASGTAPLSYQWTKNGTNVGSNSTGYTTAATVMGDNGAKIQVKVSNSIGSITSGMAVLTVTAAGTAPSITQQPTAKTVTVGSTATFTVGASGTAPLTYQWTKNGANVGTNSSTYTTAATVIGDDGSQIKVTVTNAFGSAPSNTVTLTVKPVVASSVNVLTYHNDNARTGLNANETILTTGNVKSTTFGKVGTISVDGLVDAEPLYVSNLSVQGAPHNVLFVATEHASVYAFDADTFTQLWKVSVLGAGETQGDGQGCGQVSPVIGITSTPVIDLNHGAHGAIFVVAMSKDGSNKYHHRLHALDLTTGAELTAQPAEITATVPGTATGSSGGQVVFDPQKYKERASLLLVNNLIYTTWASHCDSAPYYGWIMSYNESTLQQAAVLNITANGTSHGGQEGAIWMAGAGPAADSNGFVYLLDGNGSFDNTLNSGGFPNQGDFGNAFVKLSASGSSLTVADYFAMFNANAESSADTDLGSGGAMVLPDLKDASANTWHLAVGAGKDSVIYLVNRDMMGKFNTSNDNAIYQEIPNGVAAGVWAAPAYFNNSIYYGARVAKLKAYTFTNAKLGTTPSSQSSATYMYPGATPSISANGTSNGIVWAIENNNGGVLHAYDATNLATELYNSNQAAGGRDQFSDNKYITPMIANGKVFVGTPNSVVVFGLLP